MIFRTLFSEDALARRAQREKVDARLQVTAPHEWLLVSGIGIAFLALLAFGAFGQVETSLSVDSVVVQSGERVDVVVDVPGVVAEVFRGIGDTLAEGESIARVRPARGTHSDTGLPDPRKHGEPSGRPAREAGAYPTYDIVAPRGGEVATLAMAAGQRVEATELVARIRAVTGGPPQVLAFVTDEDALRLSPGMPARVRLAVPGEGRFLVLPARIEDVSLRARHLPAWMGELGLDPPRRAHLLRATLTDSDRQAIPDGTRGTLRIVLGHRSFVSLLFGGDRD